MEERTLKVSFNKAGSGSISTSARLPKTWIDALNITPEEREINVSFDGEKIVITKKSGV